MSKPISKALKDLNNDVSRCLLGFGGVRTIIPNVATGWSVRRFLV
jgi:hypothetical protein